MKNSQEKKKKKKKKRGRDQIFPIGQFGGLVWSPEMSADCYIKTLVKDIVDMPQQLTAAYHLVSLERRDLSVAIIINLYIGLDCAPPSFSLLPLFFSFFFFFFCKKKIRLFLERRK